MHKLPAHTSNSFIRHLHNYIKFLYDLLSIRQILFDIKNALKTKKHLRRTQTVRKTSAISEESWRNENDKEKFLFWRFSSLFVLAADTVLLRNCAYFRFRFLCKGVRVCVCMRTRMSVWTLCQLFLRPELQFWLPSCRSMSAHKLKVYILSTHKWNFTNFNL